MNSVTYLTVTCNRGCFLEQNLREQFLSNYFDLEGIDFEIIIVDDGSTDGSLEKIKQLCKNKIGIPLKYIYLKRRAGNYMYSDSTAINTGVFYSDSKFIYIASADCYICNSDAFHQLIKLESNKYVVPHLLRFDHNTTEFYKFCQKNWMRPAECYEHYKKTGNVFGEYAYYAKILGTGLIGMRKQTYHDVGGIAPIRAVTGTDGAMNSALIRNNITKDETMSSKLFVIHFYAPYDSVFLPDPAPYSDQHYELINGITIVGKEYLDIYDWSL